MIDIVLKSKKPKAKKEIKYLFLIKSFCLIAFLPFCLQSCVSQKKIKEVQEKRNQQVVSVPEVNLKPIVVAIKSRYLLKDSAAVKVFLEIDFENLNQKNIVEQMKNYFRFSWVMQPDYGVRERLAYGKLDFSEQNCILKDGKVELNFEIQRPKNTQKGLLLAEIFEVENSKKSTNDLMIDFHGTRLSDRFGLYTSDMSMPIFRSYINQNETFQINSLIPQTKDLFLIKYNHEFDAAQSPMATTMKPAPKNLKIDEVISVKANSPLQLQKEGLYLAVEDTAVVKNGFSFLVVDERFPRYTKPEKLVKPLIYVSTSQETKSIIESSDPKQALDKYFLTITSGNQGLAKKIIKTYYRRIEEANKLFTTYKEGWKTDKGMVFIVLGPPNKVQRSRDREVWMYSQSSNFSEIIFTFNRKPNQFTENYYELVRYPEYQAYWYPFVEAWRTGNVVE